MTSLISISDLIHESWVFFKSDWKSIVKRNAWFIPAIIVFYAFYLGGIFAKNPAMVIISALLFVVCSILISIHAMRYIIAKDGGAVQATSSRSLLQLFGPALLIGLLTGFAVLGGYILLILPGIWFAVASSMAISAFLEEGVTGTTAIARSMELVKGRWWKTLWRMILPSFVFQLIIGLISTVVYIIPIVLAVVGGAAAAMSFSEGASSGMSAASIPVLIIAGVLFIAATVVNLLLMLVSSGLSQVVHAKLFHSLKASR